MSYIGREPQIGNFQMCDAISVVNGQAAYTMQVGGVAVIPGGNFNVIASVNGVVQKAGTSFTISSSTITFSQNLVTGDVIDFILILGSVLDLGVPSDGTVTTGKIVDSNVTTAKIADNAVTSAKLASGLALGKIGQVVSVATTTARSTTSSSFTAVSDMTLNITPTATSSKIYLSAMQTMSFANSGGYWSHVTIFKNGSNLSANDNGLGAMRTNTGDNYITIPLIYMDSPSSTSQQTYQIYFRSPNGINVGYNSLSSGASLVAMEVLA